MWVSYQKESRFWVLSHWINNRESSYWWSTLLKLLVWRGDMIQLPAGAAIILVTKTGSGAGLWTVVVCSQNAWFYCNWIYFQQERSNELLFSVQQQRWWRNRIGRHWTGHWWNWPNHFKPLQFFPFPTILQLRPFQTANASSLLVTLAFSLHILAIKLH